MRMLAAAALCGSLVTACSEAPAPATTEPTAKPVAAAAEAATIDARVDIPRIDGARAAPADSVPGNGKGDLDEITKRSYLRVLVTPGQTHFDTSGGTQRGRTVDAVEAFAAALNAALPQAISVAYIPTTEDALMADLLAGKGDIAANLRVTFERDDQVSFATPVLSGIREWIVTGPASAPLVSLEDAGGRTVHVRRGSDHHASLIRLNSQLKQINRLPANVTVAKAGQTDEDLVNLVNRGSIPSAIIDDYLLEACCAGLTSINVNRDVAVSQDGIIAWATRKDSPKLLALINEFFAKHRLTF